MMTENDKPFLLRKTVRYEVTQPPNPQTAISLHPFAGYIPSGRLVSHFEPDLIRHDLSIRDLHQMFRNVTITPLRFLMYYIYRSYRLRSLNAYISLNTRAHFDAVTLGRKKPTAASLWGIPIAIKDNIAVKGMPNTAGAIAMRHSYPREDAFLVKKLKKAGAIITGKTNLSEWARWLSDDQPNGFSALGGQVRSPFKWPVNPCGSSAGSAVAVMARLAHVAIGTETSGSIICPAAANGVVGLKPTLGAISRDGIIPITDAQDTAGIMALRVRDVARVAEVIYGVDENDPATAPASCFKGIEFDVPLIRDSHRGRRYGMMLLDESSESPEFAALARTLNAQSRAFIAQCLAQEVDVVEIPASSIPDVKTPYDIFYYGMKHGLNAYLAKQADPRTLTDIIAFNNTWALSHIPYGQNLLERSNACSLDEAEYQALVAQNRAEKQGILDRLKREFHVDFLLSRGSHHAQYYAPAGYPAISIPIGLDEEGLPLGMTIIGEAWQDIDLLTVAYGFEKMLDVVIPPPLMSPSSGIKSTFR